MEPLARALDILQSDTGMYLGYLLPVLTTLKEKLDKISITELKDCHPLLTAVQQGIHKRYLLLY